MREYDYSVSADAERVLRSSVPEHHKNVESPIGAVQNYIAELEGENARLQAALKLISEEEMRYDGDAVDIARKALADQGKG